MSKDNKTHSQESEMSLLDAWKLVQVYRNLIAVNYVSASSPFKDAVNEKKTMMKDRALLFALSLVQSANPEEIKKIEETEKENTQPSTAVTCISMIEKRQHDVFSSLFTSCNNSIPPSTTGTPRFYILPQSAHNEELAAIISTVDVNIR